MGCDDVSSFTSSGQFSADPRPKSAAADLAAHDASYLRCAVP